MRQDRIQSTPTKSLWWPTVQPYNNSPSFPTQYVTISACETLLPSSPQDPVVSVRHLKHLQTN